MHTCGIANNAVSFSGVVIILNNRESNNIYISASISTFQIAVFVLGNLFWAKYRYISWKYELIKYPVCISFTVTGKCIPLRTFLCIIFNILLISVCFSKNFCISMPVLIRVSNSSDSWKYDLSGLWYVSEITPSWHGELSLKSVFSSGSMSDKLQGISGTDFYWFRRGSINWIWIDENFPTYIL